MLWVIDEQGDGIPAPEVTGSRRRLWRAPGAGSNPTGDARRRRAHHVAQGLFAPEDPTFLGIEFRVGERP